MRGPALVTCAYFLVYYAFMVLQLKTRSAAMERARAAGVSIAEGKTFATDAGDDAGARMGERTFLNTLEQMGTFLCSLWMCSAFVSAELATILGGTAVISRAFFPLLWSMGKGGAWSWRVELSTQPYYVCVLGMLGVTGIWAITGVNVAVTFSTMAVIGTVMGCYAFTFALSFAVGTMLHSWTHGVYEQHSKVK